MQRMTKLSRINLGNANKVEIFRYGNEWAIKAISNKGEVLIVDIKNDVVHYKTYRSCRASVRRINKTCLIEVIGVI